MSDRKGAARGALGSTTAVVYYVLLVVVAVSWVLTARAGSNLLSAGNIEVMMTSLTLLGFVAIGQTHAILVGSLDLSVGYVMSLSSVLCAGLLAGDPANIPVAVITALLVCAVVGCVNGFLVGVLHLNGFIVTLGVGLVVSGYLSTNYRGAVDGVPSALTRVGAGSVGPFPLSTLVMMAALVLMFVLLRKTRLGHHVYGVGGNAEVTRFSGITNAVPVIFAHAVSSAFAGIAGVVLVSRLGVGSPIAGTQGAYDLLSIAAVVLGGSSLAGGRGSLWGTFAGILLFAVIDSTMSILQVNPFLKDVVRGVVIVAAVAAFARRQTRPPARFDRTGSRSDVGAPGLAEVAS